MFILAFQYKSDNLKCHYPGFMSSFSDLEVLGKNQHVAHVAHVEKTFYVGISSHPRKSECIKAGMEDSVIHIMAHSL